MNTEIEFLYVINLKFAGFYFDGAIYDKNVFKFVKPALFPDQSDYSAAKLKMKQQNNYNFKLIFCFSIFRIRCIVEQKRQRMK